MIDAYDISASAMSAQRLRLDVISSNLANVNTTRQADGTIGAYRKRNVVFAPLLQDKMGAMGRGFASTLPLRTSVDGARGFGVEDGQVTLKASIQNSPGVDTAGVQVMSVDEDTNTPLRMVYDPSHPDAGPDGFVRYPNINPVTEMVDMISATRAYEANATAFQDSKTMNKAALDI